jgi:hypothetical protein
VGSETLQHQLRLQIRILFKVTAEDVPVLVLAGMQVEEAEAQVVPAVQVLG